MNASVFLLFCVAILRVALRSTGTHASSCKCKGIAFHLLSAVCWNPCVRFGTKSVHSPGRNPTCSLVMTYLKHIHAVALWFWPHSLVLVNPAYFLAVKQGGILFLIICTVRALHDPLESSSWKSNNGMSYYVTKTRNQGSPRTWIKLNDPNQTLHFITMLNSLAKRQIT
jgi:hypothetical protein